MRHSTPQHQEEGFNLDGSDLDSNGSAREIQEDEEDSDLEQVMSALRVPGPGAEMAELRKALALCQRTLTAIQALKAALPPNKCKAILNKSDSLNETTGRVAKKFALLYRLWVIEGLFPITSNSDVDLFSAGRRASPDAKRDAVIAELFMITPNLGSAQRDDYIQGFRFCVLRRPEPGEIQYTPGHQGSISDATIFTSLARKGDDPEMKRLSMEDGTYHRLSPFLFADPNQMTPDGFLRNPVLVNIIRLLLFGKASLTKEKARGGPKARGQIHNFQSVTEGLIATAAIFFLLEARYLLTPDPKLQAVGSETKISYEADYDFYLERLLKRSDWAIKTINFFNTGIFGSKKDSNLSTEPTVLSAPSRTWEDDFLDDLDNAQAELAVQVPTSASSITQPTTNTISAHGQPSLSFHHGSPTHSPQPSPTHSPVHSSPSHSPVHPLLPPPPTLTTSMASIHNHLSAASMSSVSKLQVDVGQMSINSTIGSTTTTDRVQVPTSGRRVSSARRVIPAQLPESSMPPAGSEPLVRKRATRSHTKTTGKK
ncbi:hypothetical protein JVU11DRAFT_9278 [Chiua virens]|nr:hypothetical protein JVU11DRAFT_9275 [Chiua virens]KAG9310685.1 hypothetical protein JVU11DRAFT_9278 [Chiua virens]